MSILQSPVARVACLLWLAPALSGCGLVTGGTRQSVYTDASPAGARVESVPQSVGYATPTTLELERGKNYTLSFSAPGYAAKTVEVRRSIRPWVVVADILMGVVPVVIDAATGSWYRLTPASLSVSLDRAVPGDGPDHVRLSLTMEERPDQNRLRIDSTAPGVTVTVQRR